MGTASILDILAVASLASLRALRAVLRSLRSLRTCQLRQKVRKGVALDGNSASRLSDSLLIALR